MPGLDTSPAEAGRRTRGFLEVPGRLQAASKPARGFSPGGDVASLLFQSPLPGHECPPWTQARLKPADAPEASLKSPAAFRRPRNQPGALSPGGRGGASLLFRSPLPGHECPGWTQARLKPADAPQAISGPRPPSGGLETSPGLRAPGGGMTSDLVEEKPKAYHSLVAARLRSFRFPVHRLQLFEGRGDHLGL